MHGQPCREDRALRPLLRQWIRLEQPRKTTARLLAAAALLLMPFALPASKLVQQLDEQLFDLRAELAPRNASDKFVFVAIDKESLDQVGIWPWPRSVHAAVIDALVEGAAGDIFLDIDFSTPSSPEEDRQLADALERAGGVMLPVFEQHQHVSDAAAVSVTRPIDDLAKNAWLVAANVALDPNGLFRSLDTSVTLDGDPLSSAAVVLSGVADPGVPELAVDFSIRPETVAAVSVADLLQGRVEPGFFAGRSVVVGAYATELKDLFPVPIYGILSGPMLHILAAETLVQGRVPERLPVWPLGLVLAFVILAGSPKLREQRLVPVIASAAAFVVCVEIGGYFLQKEYSLLLPSATLHLMLIAALVVLLMEKIGVSAWLAEIASAEKRNSRRILKRVISDSIDAVIIVDGDRKILDQSRAAATFFGPRHELKRGGDFRLMGPPEITQALDRIIEAGSQEEKLLPAAHEEVTLVSDGQFRHLEASLTLSRVEDLTARYASSRSFVACITVRDVTARRVYEDKLRRLAQLDDLTGVFNRRELINRVDQSVNEGMTMAVAAVDLHRFATINSTFGRATGDQLLHAVARRLMAGVRDIGHDPNHAFVGRLGGDVFCVALALASDTDIADLPQALLSLFEKNFDARSAKIHVDVRIGASLANEGLDNAANWIDAAELALDQAKKVGGSGWHVYEPLAAIAQARSMRLEQEMRSALRDNQFYLLYQPQVDLDSGEITGSEALIRWKHPELGLVSPLQFIEVAESNGFICDLGRWVLLEACSAASRWPSHLTVSVNVSAVQFAKGDLCADVREALAISGLEPHRLHIEVTESTFLLDPERLLEEIQELKSLGIAAALDDFGTGYSSLSYIARFPFDKIKIDQCFVRGIVSSPSSQAIVRSVKSLADGLGMAVVCEGVEEEAEWRLLRNLGCQEGQGYYFGKPQTAQEFVALAGGRQFATLKATA
ncbi:EAL domain-containing protein [Pseudorhizobium pelagicum]|uniref:EAL domain-containing protein n=2 Tax=Pseudorhizobium pelagicum TaxID=1509405 RepID=UPI0009E05FB1|nr:EAL domain-containing protein [Pseudorhizobium pelagicum]